jgi:hypothetical protein
MIRYEYKARTKAGRAWIARILDSATYVTRIEIDNVTDARTRSTIPVELLQRFVEIDGRDAVIYEIDDTAFVYVNVSGASGRHVTKYEIRTYAFDASDLPEMERSR